MLIGPVDYGQGILSNIVELKKRCSSAPPAVSADLHALQELQALCEEALAAGGLDEASTLELTVAVHRALKGSEWNVRFYRGQATGL